MIISEVKHSGILHEILVCPKCRSDLVLEADALRCVACACDFPLLDSERLVPQFAWPDESAQKQARMGPNRRRYEWTYQDAPSASRYAHSFRKRGRKRRRTRRELTILEELLTPYAASRAVLDIPCGGGRLSAPLSKACRYLLEADISPAQLALALASRKGGEESFGMVTSAFSLPLKDASVDGVVCARLSHHLPDADERRFLLEELMRVSSRFVIFSFVDRVSLKSFARRLSNRPLNPSAMSLWDIAEIARSRNFAVKQCRTVSHLGSRHRYVLIGRV